MDDWHYLRKRARRLMFAFAAVAITVAVAGIASPDNYAVAIAIGTSVILALTAIEYSIVLSTFNERRMRQVIALLTRIADAVDDGKVAAMVKPGNWYVDLDDSTGADRHAEIDGAVRLEVGELLQGRLHGRRWKIDRVDPAALQAHAVPAD